MLIKDHEVLGRGNGRVGSLKCQYVQIIRKVSAAAVDPTAVVVFTGCAPKILAAKMSCESSSLAVMVRVFLLTE